MGSENFQIDAVHFSVDAALKSPMLPGMDSRAGSFQSAPWPTLQGNGGREPHVLAAAVKLLEPCVHTRAHVQNDICVLHACLCVCADPAPCAGPGVHERGQCEGCPVTQGRHGALPRLTHQAGPGHSARAANMLIGWKEGSPSAKVCDFGECIVCFISSNVCDVAA
eukprot:1162046-Pelagomonas_calceolata.AAC.13